MRLLRKRPDLFARVDLMDIDDPSKWVEMDGSPCGMVDTRTVKQLLKDNKDWVSTREHHAPATKTGVQLDNLAAVIMGRKPVASVSVEGDERTEAMVELAREQGLMVIKEKAVTLSEDGGIVSQDYVVGKPKAVRKYLKAFAMENSPKRDRLMGLALGYHKDAIEDYVARNQAKGLYGKSH